MLVKRFTNTGPQRLDSRLTIKRVGNNWLNNRYDNMWTEYTGDLKPGTYAMVAGEWRNVRRLDSSILAHI